ncbi:hypothetical protein OG911_28430 [Streptomyces sp. NBC_00208]|uniref:hypothetical protein n=1 Tax=Streptomyces sp. NBC_00208 TaxID=2975681 RepID=UPI002E2B553C|nr:hypothetical protein [Streptomyces sp. NBC_00208]
MTNRTSLAVTISAVALGAVALSGCSDDGEAKASASMDLLRCEQFLGAGNVRSVLDSIGEGDPVASARRSPTDLAGRLAREAREWTEQDLLHDSYRACRIDVPAEDGDGGQVVEATVKWSVLTVKSMSEPKHAQTWRKVNDQVFVETETGRPSMRLLVPRGVSGAPSGQKLGLPLEMEVADSGLDVDQREKLLTTFARALTGELACADTPEIPAALPG